MESYFFTAKANSVSIFSPYCVGDGVRTAAAARSWSGACNEGGSPSVAAVAGSMTSTCGGDVTGGPLASSMTLRGRRCDGGGVSVNGSDYRL